jgi:glycosyltransferase involved in cell wall biosynthesis
MPTLLCTVIILTFNEQRHIARAILSVAEFSSKVVVVDSGSTDQTVSIAESLGATVLFNPFRNQAQQFQWALDNAPIASDWIMRLDADEIVEPDLAREISAELPRLPQEIVGVNLRRKHVFMGRFIRHGGRYPLVLLRIWRRGHGRLEQRWMDEHVIVWGGGTVTFKGGFADWNLNDLSYFIDKHNKYATREAVDVLNSRYRFFPLEPDLAPGSASWQAVTKRWLKNRVYNPLPFWLGPLLYFLHRYFFRLGILDGREGLIYHVLQGFWYRFLVGAKVIEYEEILSNCESNTEKIQALERITGLSLR